MQLRFTPHSSSTTVHTTPSTKSNEAYLSEGGNSPKSPAKFGEMKEKYLLQNAPKRNNNNFDAFTQTADCSIVAVIPPKRKSHFVKFEPLTFHDVLSSFSETKVDGGGAMKIPQQAERVIEESTQSNSQVELPEVEGGVPPIEILPIPPSHVIEGPNVLPTSNMLDVSSPQPVAASTPAEQSKTIEFPPPESVELQSTQFRPRNYAIPRRRILENIPYKMISQGTFGDGEMSKIMSFGYIQENGDNIYMVSLRNFNEMRQRIEQGIQLFMPQWEAIVSEQNTIQEAFKSLERGRKFSMMIYIENAFYLSISSELPSVDIRQFTDDSIDRMPTTIGITLSNGEWRSLLMNIHKINTDIENLRHLFAAPPLQYDSDHFHRC